MKRAIECLTKILPFQCLSPTEESAPTTMSLITTRDWGYLAPSSFRLCGPIWKSIDVAGELPSTRSESWSLGACRRMALRFTTYEVFLEHVHRQVTKFFSLLFWGVSN